MSAIVHPSSPRSPSPTRGEGDFGRADAQNERRNAKASKKPAHAPVVTARQQQRGVTEIIEKPVFAR